MFTTWLLVTSGAFGTTPITSEVEKGAQLRKKTQSISRNDSDSVVTIGKWFNGSKHVVTEELVLLTPGLLSRDAGYVAPKDDVQSAWDKATAQFAKSRHALIRLARLNPISINDGDMTEIATPDALDNVRFTWQSPTSQTLLKPLIVQDRQDRSPNLVLGTDWRTVLSSFTAWPTPPHNPTPMYSEIRWGRNRVVSYFVEVPEFQPGEMCSLEIVEPDRTRTIKFRTPKN